MHCEEPACAAACPTGAIIKRKEDGIVVVDRDRCNGCRDCFSACPFGVPQFGKDGIMQICNYCLDNGAEPACALACPSKALKFGPVDSLRQMAAGRTIRKMTGTTRPSIVIVS
jgi:anaerobic dimethyl sulfoxide reductase subunit B (iron-sulfur subunit)